MKGRVKYYSADDMLFGYNLSKIETLQIPSFEKIDINDAIEFFQIELYFNMEIRSKKWTDEEIEAYTRKSKELSGLAKRFFNQLNNDNIVEKYNTIELGYHDAFWTLFDKCKLYDRISPDTFKNLINSDKVSPRDLFLHKNVVFRYGNVLRDYILDKEYCINIVLHVYEQDYLEGHKLILPKELTGDDICSYIEKYIGGEHPNANYLREIVNMHATKQFPITDEIRLKAKKRYESEIENLSKTGVSFYHEIKLSLDPKQDEEKIINYNEHEFSVSYSVKWLTDTLDYPSILNNFIYVFEFVDVPQMRCLHVNKVSQSGLFERAFGSKSKRVYPCNGAFERIQRLAAMQMEVYYSFLERQNIRLEDVIEWCFTEYLQREFSCAEFRLIMPSANSTFAEKCSSIITAFESVLKQYQLFVKHGSVDFELLKMSTTPIRFEDMKSMIADKYIYGKGADYKSLSFWLFSDQCMFSLVERLYNQGKQYDNLFELLMNEQVFLSDYHDEERRAFENMESFDLVSIEDDGRIRLKNMTKIAILYDLHKNEVISQKRYQRNAIAAINDFLEKGIIETESKLFTRPECEYLNYLLNRAEYSNGLEVRNRYIHGVSQVDNNEEEHRKNYLLLLRLFVLLAIKINDEFCLREECTVVEDT